MAEPQIIDVQSEAANEEQTYENEDVDAVEWDSGEEEAKGSEYHKDGEV